MQTFFKTRPLRSDAAVKAYKRLHSRCEHCGSRRGLQVHHLKTRGSGGGDEANNLMVLCLECHHKAHNQPGFNAELRRRKDASRDGQGLGDRPGAV